MPEKIGLFLVVLATLCGCSMVKAGWVDNMKCRACVKLAPYAGGKLCHVKCDEINIFPETCGKICSAMVHKHPGTVCWAARLCKRSQISNLDEAGDLYELDGGVSSSGDFVDFDSPQVTHASLPRNLMRNGLVGPKWTRGEMEAPEGEINMGTWVAAVYTEEQQARLGVDERGNKVGFRHIRRTSALSSIPKGRKLLKFKWYGNWCGPGWTAGTEKKEKELVPSDRDYPCIDTIDCACREHDFACQDGGCCAADDERLARVVDLYGHSWRTRRIGDVMRATKYTRKC